MIFFFIFGTYQKTVSKTFILMMSPSWLTNCSTFPILFPIIVFFLKSLLFFLNNYFQILTDKHCLSLIFFFSCINILHSYFPHITQVLFPLLLSLSVPYSYFYGIYPRYVSPFFFSICCFPCIIQQLCVE